MLFAKEFQVGELVLKTGSLAVLIYMHQKRTGQDHFQSPAWRSALRRESFEKHGLSDRARRSMLAQTIGGSPHFVTCCVCVCGRVAGHFWSRNLRGERFSFWGRFPGTEIDFSRVPPTVGGTFLKSISAPGMRT